MLQKRRELWEGREGGRGKGNLLHEEHLEECEVVIYHRRRIGLVRKGINSLNEVD